MSNRPDILVVGKTRVPVSVCDPSMPKNILNIPASNIIEFSENDIDYHECGCPVKDHKENNRLSLSEEIF